MMGTKTLRRKTLFCLARDPALPKTHSRVAAHQLALIATPPACVTVVLPLPDRGHQPVCPPSGVAPMLLT